MTGEQQDNHPDEKLDAELVRVDSSEFEDGDEFDPEAFADEENDSSEADAQFEEEN